MSKKNYHNQSKQTQQRDSSLDHSQEYGIIRSDLVKVVALNTVYLVVIMALYFANRRDGAVDNWFSKILHF